jgi:hypothetical protein
MARGAGAEAMRKLLVAALAAMAACTPAPSEVAVSRAVALADALPPMQSFGPAHVAPPMRPNVEIAQDFLDLAFRMESGRPIPILTRFEGPIGVRVAGSPPPTLVPDLRALIDRLRSEAGIDIYLTGAPAATITIEAIPRSELARAVPRAACFVAPRIASWEEYLRYRRTAQVDWTTLTRRDRAAIFVPADVAPQEIRDCLHEELAQALGPLNDLYRLPDSVFNDDNIHAILTGFDMLVLRLHYAPELRNGMSRADVAQRLPALLARLNPAGERPGTPASDTSRDWIDLIETALSPDQPVARRRDAAEQAINLVRAFGWDGPRKGFALYAFGRLQIALAPDLALAAFTEAARTYALRPETAIHEAHVAVQLAAFALNAGDAERVLALTQAAIPVARDHQNAALLSTLMMLRAEALELLGDRAGAAALRLDSLGWARYGFGSESNVRARAREIAALSPLREG